MPNADLAFGLLGTELWSAPGLGLGARAYRRFGREGLVEFAGEVLVSCRDWLTETFRADATHGLLAPWVLHTGLGPDQASSGFMAQVIAVAIQLGGMPVPRGGGSELVRRARRDRRGRGRRGPRPGADVERVVVEDESGARGVVLAGGERVDATRAVVCSTTPQQLYDRLLDGAPVPDEHREAARRFRFGRGDDADPLRALRASRTGRATSGSGRRRSSTSRRVSTASRARSTRPSAGCSRPRRRSSSASR